MKSPRAIVCMLSSVHPARDKRVFEKEAISLSQAGLSVVHVCPTGKGEHPGTEVVEGVRIRRLPPARGLFGRFLRVPLLAYRAVEENAAVYHCNEVDSWISGVVAAKLRRSRVVFDVHEHYPSTFAAVHAPSWLRRPAEVGIRALLRMLSWLTDGFVFAKATVADDFPIPEERTALVRNLPPLRLLESAPGSADHVRTRGVVAVHTGYTGRIRGWPQLLDALEQDEAEGVQALFVGEFNDGSGDEFGKHVTRLGLSDRVRVMPWQPFEGAFHHLVQSDIGLILFQPGIQNHTFASPHKLFEYMLAGLPVIAPAFALEVREIVSRYRCGILVDPSEPSEIAEALASLAGAPELRREMGMRGREAVLESLNWECEVIQLYDLYERLGISLQHR